MKEASTISIITVCYNAREVIIPTIESVIGQTYPAIEYLIIDGHSTDGTQEIVQRYATHIQKLISEPDRGVYDAMNKGLELASGQYVLFLNAGDALSGPNVLSIIFQHGVPDTDLYYGETNIIDQNRRLLGTRSQLTSRKLPEQLRKKDFLKGQVVSHQSFIPRRDLCEPYDLRYSCSADIDWMLQILSRSSNDVNVNQPISNYLQGGISDTNLFRCWKERFLILLRYFSWLQVLGAHVHYGVRFLKYGRYRQNRTAGRS